MLYSIESNHPAGEAEPIQSDWFFAAISGKNVVVGF
jgi:hypothetical protein